MRRPALIWALCLLLSLNCTIAPAIAGNSQRSSEGIPVLSSQPPDVLRAMLASVLHLRKEAEKQNRSGKSTPSSLRREISLTLNEANLLMALGQSLVLAKNPSGQESLTRAMGLLRELLANKAAAEAMTAPQLGTAHRLRGMAAFYSNDFAVALKEFELSLQKDPASPEAVWTAFMAAEEHFEESNFKRAAELYRFVQRRSPPRSKPALLARFKVAWCAVNLGDFAAAESEFLGIVHESKDEQFAMDAARDLAFVAARTRNEAQLLALFDQKLTSSGARGLAFLKKSTSTLESQGKLAARSPLRERTLSLEKDPSAKVAIQLDSIQGVSREYASLPHVERIFEVLAAAVSLPVEKRDPLEVSSEKVLRIFFETYAGRAKTPENISKPVIAATLKRHVAAHLKTFPKSKKKSQMIGILLDVCELEKDALCLVSVADQVIAESGGAAASASPIVERARESRLFGLEILQAAPDAAEHPEIKEKYRSALAQRLADPRAKNGAVAGAKLAQLQVAEKNYVDAVQTLTAVLKRQPTQEYWYGLKWAQLQGGDFAGVMAQPQTIGIPTLTGVPDPRLNSVLAEATLKLASKSRETGDIAQMGANIRRFEQLAADPAKINLARDEWFETLLQKKALAEAIQRLAEFPPGWHRRPSAVALKSRLLALVIENGELSRISKWILDWAPGELKGPDSSLVLLGLLYWGGARSIPTERVRALDEVQRNVWLSTSVLAQPDWALSYFRRFAPVTQGERAMDALAHRLLGLAPPVDPTAPRVVTHPPTEFERAAAKVSFPGKLPISKHTRALQKVVAEIKALRARVVPALNGQTAEVQVRIIEAQKRLEQGAATAILGSPTPAGLATAQLNQYKDGLRALAAEFEAQVVELDSARQKIQAKIKESELALEAEERSKTLPALPNPDPLVPGEELVPEARCRNVIKLVRSQNIWGAAMELERLRSAKLVEDPAYWSVRTWIWASREGVAPGQKKQSPVLRRYLFDELSDAGMKGVIEKWKTLAGEK